MCEKILNTSVKKLQTNPTEVYGKEIYLKSLEVSKKHDERVNHFNFGGKMRVWTFTNTTTNT